MVVLVGSKTVEGKRVACFFQFAAERMTYRPREAFWWTEGLITKIPLSIVFSQGDISLRVNQKRVKTR